MADEERDRERDEATDRDAEGRPPFEDPVAVVHALYDAISFEPDGEPDWDLARSLFLPGARLRFSHMPGSDQLYDRDVDGWLEDFRDGMEEVRERGFAEEEIGRRERMFRDVAHVWSAYASRYADQERPFVRGLNSFQLLRWAGEWKLSSVVWDVETEDVPLPEGLGS